jgi:membrane-associated phospholipid phosphatase
LILFFIGCSIRNTQTVQTGWALLQAELIGLLISSGYKAITGRDHPLRIIIQDNSRVFHFGWMRNGVFWGWPSSHTTIAFAMALVIVRLYPKSRWLGLMAILYAGYVGVGVSVTIHWFSDFVAGAIIGAVIGVVVGRSYFGKQN